MHTLKDKKKPAELCAGRVSGLTRTLPYADLVVVRLPNKYLKAFLCNGFNFQILKCTNKCTNNFQSVPHA